jgi:hypothetical protein
MLIFLAGLFVGLVALVLTLKNESGRRMWIHYCIFTVCLYFLVWRGLASDDIFHIIAQCVLFAVWGTLFLLRLKMQKASAKNSSTPHATIKQLWIKIQIQLGQLSKNRYEIIEKNVALLSEAIEDVLKLAERHPEIADKKIITSLETLESFVETATYKSDIDISIFNDKTVRLLSILNERLASYEKTDSNSPSPHISQTAETE